MCGICCFISLGASNESYYSNLERTRKMIERRGPNSCQSRQIDLPTTNTSTTIHFEASVLHLRGPTCVKQPVLDQHQNILLWNGEVFGGLECPVGENDTSVLATHLGAVSGGTSPNVLEVFSSIQGPWSVIYWQDREKKLWFGRDFFGRRSLLWHLPKNVDDFFAISSVSTSIDTSEEWQDWEEIPAKGIYCLHFNDFKTCLEIMRHPWVKRDSTENADVKENVPTLHISDVCSIRTSGQGLLSPICSFNTELPLDEDLNEIDANTLMAANPTAMTATVHEAEIGCDLAGDQLIPSSRCTLPSHPTIHCLQQSLNPYSKQLAEKLVRVLSLAVMSRVTSVPGGGGSNMAVLFSGGIDSVILAVLADRYVPKDQPIDLLNVAFEQANRGKSGQPEMSTSRASSFEVPDRQTGRRAIEELNPKRVWNFVEIDITQEELVRCRKDHIKDLIYPLNTVIDDSIGCALWFAARGRGLLKNSQGESLLYTSPAKVVLVGMGADEQLAGYSRHRTKFRACGWKGLVDEIQLEMERISERNLGRDDRVISDHSREARFPFLDENVVCFLNQLPIWEKANLQLPRGIGEKKLLRAAALELGLRETACLPKRAIQFGSRIAKLESPREKGGDTCKRFNKTKLLN